MKFLLTATVLLTALTFACQPRTDQGSEAKETAVPGFDSAQGGKVYTVTIRDAAGKVVTQGEVKADAQGLVSVQYNTATKKHTRPWNACGVGNDDPPCTGIPGVGGNGSSGPGITPPFDGGGGIRPGIGGRTMGRGTDDCDGNDCPDSNHPEM